MPRWHSGVSHWGIVSGAERHAAQTLDMLLGHDSEETAESDGSETLAVGLSGPLGFAKLQARSQQQGISLRPLGTRVAGYRWRVFRPRLP
jgi:hypothetical protein